MGLFSWLVPGNDHELAQRSYAGSESASERSARKMMERHHKSISKSQRAARQWEDQDRKRFR